MCAQFIGFRLQKEYKRKERRGKERREDKRREGKGDNLEKEKRRE